MAESSKSAAAQEKEDAVADPVAAAPRTYTVERLLAESEAFLDQPLHVVVGALHEYQPDDVLTIDEAKDRVTDWLASEIK